MGTVSIPLSSESEQIGEIRAGLDAADRGEFVPEAEMDAFFARHGAQICEVDSLTVRLRQFRAEQRTGFDLREAIESGRD